MIPATQPPARRKFAVSIAYAVGINKIAIRNIAALDFCCVCMEVC